MRFLNYFRSIALTSIGAAMTFSAPVLSAAAKPSVQDETPIKPAREIVIERTVPSETPSSRPVYRAARIVKKVRAETETPKPIEEIASLDVGAAVVLKEFKPMQPVLADAIWLAEKNILVVSKHASTPGVLVYDVNFEKERLDFVAEQTFLGFAPQLFKNRNFIFAFKAKAPANKLPAAIFKLGDDQKFELMKDFDQDIKNIAATPMSNFLATIDYADGDDLPVATPRLKLFTTPTKDGGSLVREGNALGIVKTEDVKAKDQPARRQIAGKITALAMSPMARTNEGPTNRMLALGMSARNNHTLHIVYFPNIDRDWNIGRGRFNIAMTNAIDTIDISSKTFGLLLTTNKVQGEIAVMQFDLKKQTMSKSQTLTVEKVHKDYQTHMAAVFVNDDNIIAGINDNLFLFEKNNKGHYERVDVQATDLANNEAISKILVDGQRYIVLGTKGTALFGTIKHKKLSK